MKKQLLAALILSTALATPVIAQERQHQHGAEQSAGMMMGHGADMEAHRKAMQEMRELMQRVNAATDPEERKRLMAEHRQKMQAHMAHMMSGDNAKMMQQHHERMAMMHEMMAQMAAHHAAEQAAQADD